MAVEAIQSLTDYLTNQEKQSTYNIVGAEPLPTAGVIYIGSEVNSTGRDKVLEEDDQAVMNLLFSYRGRVVEDKVLEGLVNKRLEAGKGQTILERIEHLNRFLELHKKGNKPIQSIDGFGYGWTVAGGLLLGRQDEESDEGVVYINQNELRIPGTDYDFLSHLLDFPDAKASVRDLAEAAHLQQDSPDIRVDLSTRLYELNALIAPELGRNVILEEADVEGGGYSINLEGQQQTALVNYKQVKSKNYRISIDGREVFLTEREFDYFRALAQNRGQPVGPKALADRFNVSYESVKLSIRYLRKKIEIDPYNPKHVLTVTRTGYLLMLRVDRELQVEQDVCDRFIIRRASREVSVDGHPFVRLDRNEFIIFMVFIDHPESLHALEEMSTRIVGDENGVAAVRGYLSEIKKKLKLKDSDYLSYERGGGYRFKAPVDKDNPQGRFIKDENEIENPGISIGKLSIDTNAKSVRYDGEEIHLSATEYAMLLFLAGHPGEILSYEQIINRVWGDEESGSKRNLFLYITYLRQKFPQVDETTILNIPRSGYVFGELHDEQSELLSLKDRQINLTKRRVIRNGEEAVLTAQEFKLLTELLFHKNKIIPVQRLLDTLWRDKPESNLKVLRYYIYRLRKKLEANPSNPQHILTDWGRGYGFFD